MEQYKIEAARLALMTIKEVDGETIIEGTQEQRTKMLDLCAFYREAGRFPIQKDGMREVEPGVWIK